MKKFIRKLSSRKLWVAILGLAVGIAAVLGVDSTEITQVAGLLASAVSSFAYIMGESKIDAARIGSAGEKPEGEN